MTPFSHHRSPSLAQGRAVGERGVVVILVALSMTSVLITAMLVIDGSQAYPQRRSAQNAADAAALAGAKELDTTLLVTASAWPRVATKVADVVAQNGAESHECLIVDGVGGVIGSCSDAGPPPRAAGVKVVAHDERATTFGGLTGRDTVEARAEAVATIQTFMGTRGLPFAVCGAAERGWDLLTDPDGPGGEPPSIDPVKAARYAYGDPKSDSIILQGSQAKDYNCDAGSQSKGLIVNDHDVLVTTPGWVPMEKGNEFNDGVATEVSSAQPCTPEDFGGSKPTPDCDILVPVASKGASNRMYVVAWMVLRVTPGKTGKEKYVGKFVSSNVIVTGGIASTEVPQLSSQPRVIRLLA